VGRAEHPHGVALADEERGDDEVKLVGEMPLAAPPDAPTSEARSAMDRASTGRATQLPELRPDVSSHDWRQ
jgi:hypothetical protein